MSLNGAIEHSCKLLPTGWYIKIIVENGSAVVELYDSEKQHEFDITDMSLAEQIYEALNMAIILSKKDK